MNYQQITKNLSKLIYLYGTNRSSSKFLIRNICSSYKITHSRQLSDNTPEASTTNELPKLPAIKDKISTLLKESVENSDNVILALKYCGRSSFNLSPDTRRKLCYDIWGTIPNNYHNAEVCHSYIQTCIDNEEYVRYRDFLKNVKFEPNSDTYKLLLESTCNLGNEEDALNILSLMKTAKCTADINVFNLLVLAYTISSGFSGAKSILNMMKTAHVKTTDETNWNILRGVATYKQGIEFVDVLNDLSLDFNTSYFCDVLLRLGMNDSSTNHVQKFISKMNLTAITRNLKNLASDVCVQLIHRNRPQNALQIYTDLIDSVGDDKYALFLLEEMLHNQTPVSTIITLSKKLELEKQNPSALSQITEISLKNNYSEKSWSLLKAMDVLRPHYFWPLLLNSVKEKGETGVLETLKAIQDLGVVIDNDTLHFYSIPYCNLNDPKSLINKLKLLNLTVKQVFTPILTILLVRNEKTICKEICDSYDVSVDGHSLIKPLTQYYRKTRDIEMTVLLLQKICETNTSSIDWTGMILLNIIKATKTDNNYNQYLELLKKIKGVNLTIFSSTNENIMNYLNTMCTVGELYTDIITAINNLVDISMKESSHILHPRDMDAKELECHLIELTSKQMETRGVLRLLIQEHARLGNRDRIMELRERFKSSGYVETAGMLGSIMNTHLQAGHLNDALLVFCEMKTLHPKFKIDLFKIIDLATLLVKSGQFDKAVDLLTKEISANRYSSSTKTERNCWKLLCACTTSTEVEYMFNFLTSNNICKPTNVILGPLVRIYLENNDLVKAVEVFKDCAKRYNQTPLQLELLSKIVQSDDSQNILQDVVNVIANIHGEAAARIAVMAALAENGLDNALRNFLLENHITSTILLQKRCERWITEGKLEPLNTLLKCIERLPETVIDKSTVCMAILKLYSSTNDCEGSIQFFNYVQENEILTSTDLLKKELLIFLERCKYNIPENLVNPSLKRSIKSVK